MAYTEDERAFLESHVWAVLATGRRDGSPQQGMVGYTLDGEGRLLISTRTPTARWNNIERNQRVSVAVPDGHVHLLLYGTAELIADDPERAERTADILAVVRGPERPDPTSILGWMNEERRGVVRITATKVLLHH
jgi:PPOX class probable F420-dependent enzyme